MMLGSHIGDFTLRGVAPDGNVGMYNYYTTPDNQWLVLFFYPRDFTFV